MSLVLLWLCLYSWMRSTFTQHSYLLKVTLYVQFMHVRIDPLDQMENLGQFFVDPRIDKPWGNTLREKLHDPVCLRYINWGAKERQQRRAAVGGMNSLASSCLRRIPRRSQAFFQHQRNEPCPLSSGGRVWGVRKRTTKGISMTRLLVWNHVSTIPLFIGKMWALTVPAVSGPAKRGTVGISQHHHQEWLVPSNGSSKMPCGMS